MSSNFKNIESRGIYMKRDSQDYWHYSDGDSKDILLYTENCCIYEPPMKTEKFPEGSDVLVRWTDGLLYLGNIIQVDEEYSRCAVKFEDGSQYWSLFKDIHKGAPSGYEIRCTVCDSTTSEPPDEIVSCTKCSVGYHQYCHIPKIDSSALKPNSGWNCRVCVFAYVIKKGGAVKKGPKAQQMMIVKQTLPYDINSLTWDSQHRINFQQTYCYCGGPGEWHSKMLQCLKCKQWFHEACLQCLEEPLLYGDRFYIFLCAICNRGVEFIRRLSLRWLDIAHLVLFNLTLIHNKKYFELDTTIMHFLKDKWSQLQVRGEELTRSSLEEKKQKLLETLQSSKSRFKSGKEVKKKTTVWGLLSRVPPPVPTISLPDDTPLTDEILDAFLNRKKKEKGRPEVKTKKETPVRKVRKILPHIPPENFDTNSQNSLNEVVKERKIEKEKTTKGKAKDEETKKWHRRSLRPRITRKFTQNSSASSTIDLSDSEDTTSSHDTLNSIIPHPSSFEGPNNPFMNGEPSLSSSSNSKSSSSSTTSAASSNQDSKCRRKRTRKLRCRQSLRMTRSSSRHCLISGLIGSPHFNREPDPKFLINQNGQTGISTQDVKELNSSMSNYFSAENRIADGEKFDVLAKRIDSYGRVQYLIQWESSS